ncbi:M20/M25/M40 family metallo-hydrolase [Marinicauda algicola]|uniref:M20/M25/M40 family metallo-hydrolase n=1 Tax=Marinicauda algicola TaxID=2029849 RepID=A0A4S2H466_9PROT|nr:M20/M25/M40 family metallo-hydrolase [Marinicauda algicola]TGY90440.1 M20/M25/M40 family metallo-hydrolase [Marinicauda algicola]
MKRVAASLVACLVLAACGGSSFEQPEPVAPDRAGLSEETLARQLAEAIAYPTIAKAGEPGHNAEVFAQFQAFLAREYPRVFEQLDVTDLGHGTLWFTLEGSDASLDPAVLIAHQDVVPVEPGTEGGWTYPAFDGVIADGYVWGRGAIDMKGHLVTLLAAMESLLEDGFAPQRTIHIGLGADEEVAGIGAGLMASWLEERGRRAWFVLDEGGSLVLDMPLTGRPTALIAVGEKGYLTVEVTARARGGHSSSPPQRTAVGLLARAITAIEDHPFEMSLEGGPVDEMLVALAPDMEGLQGFAASNPGLFGALIVDAMKDEDAPRAMLGTTIAPTVIEGGIVENVLPQHATALINLRLHPRTSTEDALAHLREAVAGLDGVTIKPHAPGSEAPPVAAMEGRAWEIVAGAAAAFAPEGTPVAPSLLVAGTDSRFFAGVADNIYRYSPARIEMEDLSRIHGTDERMKISNLPVMADYFRTVMVEAGTSGAE